MSDVWFIYPLDESIPLVVETCGQNTDIWIGDNDVLLTPKDVYRLRMILDQVPADCGDHDWLVFYEAPRRCGLCGTVEDKT